MLIIIGLSYVYIDNSFYIIKEYGDYIFNLIKYIIEENPNIKQNFILGFSTYCFNNNYNTIRIHYNYEHTLCNIACKDYKLIDTSISFNDINYGIRIHDFDKLINVDIIIDYSMPNIINIKSSNNLSLYYNKCIYIAPLYFDELKYIKIRSVDVLTTFINTKIERRVCLMEYLKKTNFNYLNVCDCFDINKLKEYYLNTKILINIHQNTNFNTIEELRILPALMCKVIIICEDSPLKESLPYYKYINFVKYENIMDELNNIMTNYEFYYNKYDEHFDILIDELKKNNVLNLKKYVYNI